MVMVVAAESRDWDTKEKDFFILPPPKVGDRAVFREGGGGREEGAEFSKSKMGGLRGGRLLVTQ